MKKLLFQFDTDPIASVFDTVVGYDGGADHVVRVASVSTDNCASLVLGTIFTRAPNDKRFTALFVGGSDLTAGEALFAVIQQQFFGKFRVSVMLDSNGCNTTSSAGVALLSTATSFAHKHATVLAGTGPVGQRVAVLLAKHGARVRLTSRNLARAQHVCQQMSERYGVELTPLEVSDAASTKCALQDAHIVFGAGKTGVQLLSANHWQSNPSIEVLADVNTQPPLGIEGIDMMDKATMRDGKLMFGGIGIGALKLRLHRACITRLFDSNDRVLDVEEVFEIAKEQI